jgi:Trk K+ transport system NAD-binding subunit
VLVAITRSHWVDRMMSRLIERALRRFTTIEVRDYAGLLRLSGEWMVVEMEIDPQDWIADRPLAELDLPDEGVVVLGVVRPDGRYVGAPKGATVLRSGDVAVLYGRRATLADIDERRHDAAGVRDRLENEVEHLALLAEDEAAEIR